MTKYAPDDWRAPIHPGEMLMEEFLKPMDISQYRLAKDLNIPQTRVSQIVKGKRSITVDTAMRLARYFGMSVGFWLNCQRKYDMEVAEDELKERIENEVQPLEKSA